MYHTTGVLGCRWVMHVWTDLSSTFYIPIISIPLCHHLNCKALYDTLFQPCVFWMFPWSLEWSRTGVVGTSHGDGHTLTACTVALPSTLHCTHHHYTTPYINNPLQSPVARPHPQIGLYFCSFITLFNLYQIIFSPPFDRGRSL